MNEPRMISPAGALARRLEAAETEISSAVLAVMQRIPAGPRKTALQDRLVAAYREMLQQTYLEAFCTGLTEGRRQAAVEEAALATLPEARSLTPEQVQHIRDKVHASAVEASYRDAALAGTKATPQ